MKESRIASLIATPGSFSNDQPVICGSKIENLHVRKDSRFHFILKSKLSRVCCICPAISALNGGRNAYTSRMLNLNPEATQEEIDSAFMAQALREALNAEADDEVPIGAVVVLEGKIIGRGYNQNKILHDPTAHAEMIAITAGCNKLQLRYLENATLYVTIEPCSMCAGAIVLARIKRVVFGAKDPKAGACGSVFNLVQDPRLNHRVEITSGVRDFECATLISEFFGKIRSQRKNNAESN